MSDFPDRLVSLVWFRSSVTKTVTVGLFSQGVGRLASRDLSKFLSLAQVDPSRCRPIRETLQAVKDWTADKQITDIEFRDNLKASDDN